MLASLFAAGSSFLKPEFWFDKAGAAAIWVVTAIIFAESGMLVGFFFPGDSLLFFTGFLTSAAAQNPSAPASFHGTAAQYCKTGTDTAAQFCRFAGHIPSLPVVLVLVFVAAVIGDQVGYWIGRTVGPALFRKPNSKIFRQEYITKAHAFFEKYGAKSVVLARFVPIVRTFTPLVAGVAEMKYRTYFMFDVLGALIWAVGITFLGHFLGQFQFFRDNIEYAILAVIFISLLPVAIEVIRARRHRTADASTN